jgi:hypothetical protein
MIEKELLEIVILITQILILIVLIIYIIKTWRISTATQAAAEVFALSLQVMKEARDLEIAPYVVVYFDITFEGKMIYLVVKNIGKSTARDIKIQFKPKLIGNSGEDISDLPIFKNGIASLSPDNEIRAFVDSTSAFFSEQNDHYLTFEVKILFYGGIKDTLRVTEQVLDLTADKRSSVVIQTGEHSLINEAEKISRNIERIRKEFSMLNDNLAGGVQFRNTITPASLQTGDDSWQNVVVTKLLEFNHLWSSLYGGKREKLLQPFLGKIKNRLNHITDQLLVTASLAPSNADESLKNKVLDVAAKLADLNAIRVNPNDTKTISAFNADGDKIVETIEEFVGKLKTNTHTSRS